MVGLTEDFLCSRRKFWITSKEITPSGKMNLWSDLLMKGSFLVTRMKASGILWTLSAIRTSSRHCGVRAKLLGKYGNESGVLAEKKRIADRTYGLQRKLALSLASNPRCGGHWLFTGGPD